LQEQRSWFWRLNKSFHIFFLWEEAFFPNPKLKQIRWTNGILNVNSASSAEQTWSSPQQDKSVVSCLPVNSPNRLKHQNSAVCLLRYLEYTHQPNCAHSSLVDVLQIVELKCLVLWAFIQQHSQGSLELFSILIFLTNIWKMNLNFFPF
jgi:hypothetical protein